MNDNTEKRTEEQEREARRFAENLERNINHLCRGQLKPRRKRPVSLSTRRRNSTPPDAA